MKPINYNEISNIYDDVRQGDLALIQRLINNLPSRADVRVLDIGCGTGNQTNLFQKLSGGKVYGVEPSEGMLKKARLKNELITFESGQADNIPFDNSYFDFIYMTDVIHHVPDIKVMFDEIWRVLKSGGEGCIVTQSHQQIEARPISQYFPATVGVDKKRYPDIPTIIRVASRRGFIRVKSEIHADGPIQLGEDYLDLVCKKGYSMLHLISEDEYLIGVKNLTHALGKGVITVQTPGSMLVWFAKA